MTTHKSSAGPRGGQAYKRVLICAFHKFLTRSFLSAIIMAGALARTRAPPAGPASIFYIVHDQNSSQLSGIKYGLEVV